MFYHNRLLITTSLYAMSAAFAPHAFATCLSGDGNVSAGNCTTAQNLTGTNNGTIAVGGSLSTGTAVAYSVTGTGNTLTNSGTITSSVNTGAGGSLLLEGSAGTIVNAGTIYNTATGLDEADAIQLLTVQGGITIASGGLVEANTSGYGTGIAAFNGSFPGTTTDLTGDFLNNGSIISAATAISFVEGGIAGNFTNNGLIEKTGTRGSSVISDYYGVGGSLTNGADGTIIGTVAGTNVYGINTGNIGGDLTNAGLIDTTGNAIEAISAPGGSGGYATIGGNFINSGTILSGVGTSDDAAG